LRVAIVINTSWNIFNYRRGLIHALLEKGCEVIAIAPEDEYSVKLQELGCQFVPLEMDNRGMNPFSDVSLFFRLWKTYKNLHLDYILHYTVKPNVYGSLSAKLLGIPCISNVSGLGTAFIREGFVLQMVKMLYRFAFRFPQRVFFQNNDDRQLFLKLGLVKESRTDLLPGSGINIENYQPQPYVKHQPFRFLLIARLLVDKGIKEYALASRLLKENGLDFEAQIVGFFDRKGKYNVSEDDLANWESNGCITFLGESKDIKSNISEVDCVVLPSYREGTPRSLLEAMAMSKPIIATHVPGCKEVLEEGINGFFCEAKDVASLANAMEKMMALSENELAEMGRRGREIVENKFDERVVVGKYFREIFS
jgi:glycosyltransferase involved in cell wall biosynthesis